MGMTIDDNVKQKLLDSLAKEPPMVLSTAYAYAKNYVEYGEDITKAWTTAVQQVSILEKVRQKALVEAYDSFKKDYKARLKADMVAMLTEIQLEIEELDYFEGEELINITQELMDDVKSWEHGVKDCKKLIQQKIDTLKEQTDDNK